LFEKYPVSGKSVNQINLLQNGHVPIIQEKTDEPTSAVSFESDFQESRALGFRQRLPRLFNHAGSREAANRRTKSIEILFVCGASHKNRLARHGVTRVKLPLEHQRSHLSTAGAEREFNFTGKTYSVICRLRPHGWEGSRDGLITRPGIKKLKSSNAFGL
jgi:hypothetical protein